MLSPREGFDPESRYRREKIALFLVRLAAVATLGTMAAILFFIFKNGISAISPSFLTEFPRDNMTAGGIFPAILGTLALALGALITAIPLGFGAAVYLAEYARPGPLVSVIRLGVANLAGVPSVVFG
ncbi:MAG: phosphate ABC transporter, permease protein PstA, partial [Deltaproteobacteria bacterium]|nr:phosphate ABC transporter, permease protein PstA [Deltaproteobacteria bacterium]